MTNNNDEYRKDSIPDAARTKNRRAESGAQVD